MHSYLRLALVALPLGLAAFADSPPVTDHVKGPTGTGVAGHGEASGPDLFLLRDFCRDPHAAICESAVPLTGQKRDRLLAEHDVFSKRIIESVLPLKDAEDGAGILELVASKPPKDEASEKAARPILDEALKDLEKVYDATNEAVFGEKKDRQGPNPEKPFDKPVRQVLADSRAAILAQVPEDQREAMSNKLADAEHVHVVTSATDLRQLYETLSKKNFADGLRLLTSFTGFCKANGSHRNAMVGRNGDIQYVVVCPGSLLRLAELENGKAKPGGALELGYLAGEIGHEFGHLVGYTPSEHWKPTLPGYYKKLFQCLEKNGQAAFGGEESDFPVGLATATKETEETKSGQERARKQNEISADINEAILLAATAKNHRLAVDRADYLWHALSFLCGEKGEKGYPSGKARLNMIGLYKPLRDALGCHEVKPESPTPPVSCSLKGEETL